MRSVGCPTPAPSATRPTAAPLLPEGGIARLEPAMLVIPAQRAGDALPQCDTRSVANLGTRPGCIEGAALREEIDAPPVQGRLDAERRAQELAGGTGQPERPDWQMPRLWSHTGHIGDDGGQFIQRGDFQARENIGPASS